MTKIQNMKVYNFLIPLINVEDWGGINLIVPNPSQSSERSVNMEGMTMRICKFLDVSNATEPRQEYQEPG